VADANAESEGEVEGGGDRARRPKQTAHDRALRLLTVRARSRRELRDRLLRAGFDAPEVEDTLEGLEAAGLIDDERLAKAVVEHAVTRRLEGGRSVLTALRSHGLDADLVQDELTEAEHDQARRAHELAALRAGRVGNLPSEVAFRRLVAFLVRRGYGPGLAREAAARALAVDSAPAD